MNTKMFQSKDIEMAIKSIHKAKLYLYRMKMSPHINKLWVYMLENNLLNLEKMALEVDSAYDAKQEAKP